MIVFGQRESQDREAGCTGWIARARTSTLRVGTHPADDDHVVGFGLFREVSHSVEGSFAFGFSLKVAVPSGSSARRLALRSAGSAGPTGFRQASRLKLKTQAQASSFKAQSVLEDITHSVTYHPWPIEWTEASPRYLPHRTPPAWDTLSSPFGQLLLRRAAFPLVRFAGRTSSCSGLPWLSSLVDPPHPTNPHSLFNTGHRFVHASRPAPHTPHHIPISPFPCITTIDISIDLPGAFGLSALIQFLSLNISFRYFILIFVLWFLRTESSFINGLGHISLGNQIYLGSLWLGSLGLGSLNVRIYPFNVYTLTRNHTRISSVSDLRARDELQTSAIDVGRNPHAYATVKRLVHKVFHSYIDLRYNVLHQFAWSEVQLNPVLPRVHINESK
ncbi:hypothetical protein EVG20_g8830 [Dentipellis fragilis]|uniref:Uncharacterized protein n=1 Tax=Dentipellis fragilis TaxID=205917 RepID=A0A4Y9Y3C9_9AGAM|nr:hypothetical protein EVG20_g8830 [Dentipellis fragilis]